MLQGGQMDHNRSGDGSCSLCSREADASPGHRLWPRFIQTLISKSTLRCSPALQSSVHGGAGQCQRQAGLGAASPMPWCVPRYGAGGG